MQKTAACVKQVSQRLAGELMYDCVFTPFSQTAMCILGVSAFEQYLIQLE